MKKDEYIQMLLSMVEEHRQTILLMQEHHQHTNIVLQEQHQKDKALIAELKDKISLLTCELSEMRRILSKAMKINEAKIKAEMKKMEERLEEYKDEIQKEKNKVKGLAKCLENKSEKQKKEESEEDLAKKRKEQKKKRKARGNNGAKRNSHFELETKIVDLYPDDPNFDMAKAYEIFGKDENGNLVLKTSMRLDYIPGKVIKTLYNIHRYKCNGEFYQGSAPNAVLLNSNYTASFVAMITYQRYINSMSVYRINKMFNDFGFDSKEKTFHSLMRGTATRLEPLVNAMKEEVHDSQYIAADETYFKVLVPKEENERGSRKGYFWMYFSPVKNAVYVDYQKGSRATVVAESMLHDFKGTLQSDGYTAYKKLSNKYEFIKRIACIQHIKRKFIDCGEDEEAGKFVDLFNQLYQKDHMHIIGEDGWTATKHKEWRQEYAPPILDKIEKLAEETKKKKYYLTQNYPKLSDIS